MYSNKILNFQESTTILNAHSKKSLETSPMLLISTGWLNVDGTRVTANNSTNINNVVSFFVSDLKRVYYNIILYQSSVTVPWTKGEKYFALLLI